MDTENLLVNVIANLKVGILKKHFSTHTEPKN